MFQFRIKGVKDTQKALRKELVIMKHLIAEGMREAVDDVGIEAIYQLETKDLDRSGEIEKSMESAVEWEGSTIKGTVSASSDRAYEKEVEGSFLFIALENKRHDTVETVAGKLEERYG